MMNPRSDKIPESFIHQKNTHFDPTTHFGDAKTIRCWDCNQPMRGDGGIQIMRKLAGSEVRLAVITHQACAEGT